MTELFEVLAIIGKIGLGALLGAILWEFHGLIRAKATRDLAIATQYLHNAGSHVEAGKVKIP